MLGRLAVASKRIERDQCLHTSGPRDQMGTVTMPAQPHDVHGSWHASDSQELIFKFNKHVLRTSCDNKGSSARGHAFPYA